MENKNNDFENSNEDVLAFLTEVEQEMEKNTEGTILKMPKSMKMSYIDNVITTHINNLFQTYGKEEVLKALAFHYKLTQEKLRKKSA
jgi:hypothetical protein